MSHGTAAWDVSFRLYTADTSDGRPVFPVSASLGHDQLLNGTATLTFPAGDDALDLLGSTLGSEFAEVGLRVFHVGESSDKPIWSGVAMATTLSTDRRGMATITFEHFWPHFLRRRSMVAASYVTADYNEEADNVALKVMRAQIGPTPTVPTGHPGTRTDFGSFTPTVVANHSPGVAATRKFYEQSGNNLLEVINQLVEWADLAPSLGDDLDGTFNLDVEYPFLDDDLTDTVIFGQYHGNLASFELVSDRMALANVWALEGKTATTPQWTSDGTSITAWGEFEAFAQKPQDTNDATALSQTATDLRDGYAESRIMYKAGLIESEGHEFVRNFFWRDKIRIEEATFGMYIEQTITGWSMDVEGGRVRAVDIILGVPKAPDLDRHVAGYTGRPGPLVGGSPWRNRRQA